MSAYVRWCKIEAQQKKKYEHSDTHTPVKERNGRYDIDAGGLFFFFRFLLSTYTVLIFFHPHPTNNRTTGGESRKGTRQRDAR